MTEKDLFQTVDFERRKLLKESPKVTIIWSLTLVLWLLNLYLNVVVLSCFPMLWLGLFAANMLTNIPLIYEGLRQYKFALRLTGSLEKGAISGALDLLDFNKESYRLKKRIILSCLLFSLMSLLTLLTGVSLSWWAWNSFESLMFAIFLTFTTIISVASVPHIKKLEEQDKNRKKVQELMDKCLRREEWTGA
jgi:hypothetical protein